MFLQISEPQNSEPKALGIDLGTTHSLVATSMANQIVVLKEHGTTLLPSVVRYDHNGVADVGKKAYERAALSPRSTIRSVKRLLGKSLADVATLNLHQSFVERDGQLAIETDAGCKTPVEVSAAILKSLYDRAMSQLSGVIKGAVITVPAYFDDAQRTATKQAAQLAGIEVLRLINEPTAAAIAYGLEQKTSGLCLIYDLGGGTFDVTVLKIEQGVFHVLATGGDTQLGGDDMDALIADWLIEQHGQPKDQYEALTWARQAKEALSSEESLSKDWLGKEIHLTKEKLNQLIDPIVRRTVSITSNVLKDAGIEAQDLNELILVGGSTKNPYIQTCLKDKYKKNPLCSLDPEQVVDQGAALHAASLLGLHDKKSLLIDVLPLSLGVETMGGIVEKILMRNTPIPSIAKQSFTTYENNQTGMIFHIVQGERELAKDNRSLATFTLKDLPQLPKGYAKIEVTFQINEEGLLHVSAKELTTQAVAQIEVRPSYGLSDEAITLMLEDALSSAGEDVRVRLLEQKRLDGQQLYDAIDMAYKQDSKLLSEKDMMSIKTGLASLKETLQQNNEQAIAGAIQHLESLTDEFMRNRLDNTLKNMIKGKSINQMNDVICQK